MLVKIASCAFVCTITLCTSWTLVFRYHRLSFNVWTASVFSVLFCVNVGHVYVAAYALYCCTVDLLRESVSVVYRNVCCSVLRAPFFGLFLYMERGCTQYMQRNKHDHFWQWCQIWGYVLKTDGRQTVTDNNVDDEVGWQFSRSWSLLLFSFFTVVTTFCKLLSGQFALLE